MAGHGQLSSVKVWSTWALLPAVLVVGAAPLIFAFGQRLPGYLVLVLALAIAFYFDRNPAINVRRGAIGSGSASLLRDLFLIALGQVIVSLVPLHAELDNAAFLRFTVALGGAVLVPYVISRWIWRDHAIRFPWRGGGRWSRFQWFWLVLVLFLAWLILPWYFISSGAYQNWPVVDTPDLIARLFVGVGAVGIWDELFFICTIFVLLLRHFPFYVANILQAVVFVSFLWELGYQSWGPLLTIPFALLQAFIFRKTRSLSYVVVVHLLFDAVVFAVLVHAHNPGIFDWLFLI